MHNVINFYLNKISHLSAQERRLKARSNACLYAKLLFFLGVVVFAYWTYRHFGWPNLTAALLCAAAYVTALVLDSQLRSRIDALRAKQRVCRNEIDGLGGTFSAFRDGSEYVNPQHEYAYDLDIFGKDSLFNRINRTVTRKGSDRLAERLTRLSEDKQDILERQAAVAELAQMPDWRIEFLSHPFTESHLDLMAGLLDRGKPATSALRTTLPYLSVGLTLSFLILGWTGVCTWASFGLMFTAQLSATLLTSRLSAKTNAQAETLCKEFTSYLHVLRDIERAEFRSKRLVEIRHDLFLKEADSLAALRQLARILNLYNQRGNAVVYIALNGLFLFDIALIRMFAAWKRTYTTYINMWVSHIAEVDALVSLATYAYNHPHNCLPHILGDDADCVIRAENVCHPFLNPEKAVPNSFTLRKKNVAIITGANMAGKSTFLRTIGVTYVLAVNGVPVCAERFGFAVVSLFSSMRTTDDLTHDISYFNAELIRLKNLIRHVRSHRFTLIILDEILKGTNSKDKLTGSVLFLREIAKYDIAALIATHDLELAKLEEQAPSTYVNYCFEIELSEDIKYTYRIQRGAARNMNGSYLLAKLLQSV